jgi:hypothetical protein
MDLFELDQPVGTGLYSLNWINQFEPYLIYVIGLASWNFMNQFELDQEVRNHRHKLVLKFGIVNDHFCLFIRKNSN